jgi:signal transduction histidine kinase
VRPRITLLVAATTSIVLLAFLLPAAALVTRVAAARAVDRAQDQVQSLTPTVGLAKNADEVLQGLVGTSPDLRVGVLWTDGTWLGAQGVTRPAAVPTSPKKLETAEGTRLIQPVTLKQGTAVKTAVIEVLVPRALLRAGVTRTWLVLTGLGVVLLVLALLVADRLARSLTRPVDELAATAHQLGSGELTARVRPDGPAEVREVGVALNRLAERIGELLTAEREAAADLAHRLRTPLTALRLDAEALPPAERDRILDGVDALNRGVDEVINEARRPVREGLGAVSDAVAVVADRVRFWQVLAEDEGRPLGVDLPAAAIPVRVSADDLAAAVDALLGNVFAHTPDGTRMAVAVRGRPEGGAVVSVRDDGPGIRAEAVERGRSGGGSTGLGLDIARRTAEASGGALHLATSVRGTEVVLELGPPAD